MAEVAHTIKRKHYTHQKNYVRHGNQSQKEKVEDKIEYDAV